MSMKYDLLQGGEVGGCSAKIPAGVLDELLSGIEMLRDENVLVNGATHDDAGVYLINETTALIATTDFFPPICSDPYEFGQIAAANSLSDVYAMGGRPLLVLNINMFPSDRMPLEVLADILKGGQSKINESGAMVMGGHTIVDTGVKYGLAVVGTVDPKRVIANSGAKVGDLLLLTKPLGSGVLVAAKRMDMANDEAYRAALDGMKQLNDHGARLMQKYKIKAATDITGFGLLGHAMRMADASGVTFEIDPSALPILPQVMELLSDGCVPGTVFKNLDFTRASVDFGDCVNFDMRAVALDAQTSGGLLISAPRDIASNLLEELREHYPSTSIVGSVAERGSLSIRYGI